MVTANLRIVLVGKTGSGKSSVGNTILGRDAFRASFISSTQTCEKEETLRSGRTISIIDTPGLLDVRWYKLLEDKLKRGIETCLSMSTPGPHVLLLVIRPNGRHTDEESNTMGWIQNFREDAVHQTIVLFSHADLLKGESLDQYIRKSPDLQSLIDRCGGRFHSFNNEDRNNQNQVNELLEKIDKLIRDNKREHYSFEKNVEKQKDTKPPLSVSVSQETRGLIRINQGEEINTQSEAERSDGDDEVRVMMERGLDELRRETDQLFRLVMDLKTDEIDLMLSLKK